MECFLKHSLFSTDADGSITLRPGNKYEFMFGFELPQAGWVSFRNFLLQILHSNINILTQDLSIQVLGFLVCGKVWLSPVLREGRHREIRPVVCRMQAIFRGGGTH